MLTLRRMTTHHDHTTGESPMENPYAAEAEQRWGHTEAYRQSQERVKRLTKEDWERIKNEGDALLRKLVSQMEAKADPASPQVQELIAQHYDGLRTFYEPNLELYAGLANMYVDDARFTAFYDKYASGLAAYLRDGMLAYCDARKA